MAGKLYGKLMFMSSQYVGRLGRALPRALSRRQHEFKRAGLNPQLIAAIAFWIIHMRDLRVREVPVDLCEAPLFLSYSDGEGEGAGVGVAFWCPDGSSIGGYIALPEVVRSVWSRSAVCGDHYDISRSKPLARLSFYIISDSTLLRARYGFTLLTMRPP